MNDIGNNEQKEIVRDVWHIIKQQPQWILWVPELLLVILKSKNINCILLKRQRWYLANTPDKHDSYIIGIHIWNEILAIKIHPDIFRCCKTIYEDKNLLEALRKDEDIPNIIETFSTNWFRVVFYIWEKLKTLDQHLKNSPNIPLIQSAFQQRLTSIGNKWITLACLEPDDVVFCDSRPHIKIIDPNKLWRKNSPIWKHDSGIVWQGWLKDLLEKVG